MKEPTVDPWEVWVRRLVEMVGAVSSTGACPYGIEATDKGFGDFLKVLFLAERQNRPESTAAVRVYIETGAWPEQSPWAEYITYLRVQCAGEFVCQLTCRDESAMLLQIPSGLSDCSFLTWLLIDHWNRCSDMWLKLNAVSFFFSLPFYGLTPARE